MSELSPDVSAQQILRAVGRYLVETEPDAEDLILVRSPWISARSRIYQLATRGGEPRFVVKFPAPNQPSLDSQPPLSAAAQFAALQRARALLEGEDAHAVARPVALLHEPDGLIVQYVPGATVSKVIKRCIWEPARAHRAAAAAGDALRRLHRRAQRPARDTSLSDLVDDILEVEASTLSPIGLQLPAEVRRPLDSVPALTLTTRRVLLHGDYVAPNLILTRADEVTMIDPVLASEGLPEDDVTRFLTVLSSAPVFVPGALLRPLGARRRDLERAFLEGYGDADQPVILELRLIRQHVLRWRRRRELSRLAHYAGLMDARARVIDQHMRGLLLESSRRLSQALAESPGLKAEPA